MRTLLSFTFSLLLAASAFGDPPAPISISGSRTWTNSAGLLIPFPNPSIPVTVNGLTASQVTNLNTKSANGFVATDANGGQQLGAVGTGLILTNGVLAFTGGAGSVTNFGVAAGTNVFLSTNSSVVTVNGVTDTNAMTGLLGAITNGAINNLTNYTLLVSQNATNQSQKVTNVIYAPAVTGLLPATVTPTNTLNQAGVVTPGSGNPSLFWGTDSGGAPGWRSPSAGGAATNAVTIISGTNVALVNPATNLDFWAGPNVVPFFTNRNGQADLAYQLLGNLTNNTSGNAANSTNDSTGTLLQTRFLQFTNNDTAVSNYAALVIGVGATNDDLLASNKLWLQITNVYVATGTGGSTNVSGQTILYTVVPGSGGGIAASAGVDILLSTNSSVVTVNLNTNMTNVASISFTNGSLIGAGAPPGTLLTLTNANVGGGYQLIVFTNGQIDVLSGITNGGFSALGVVTNDANGKLYTTPTLPAPLAPGSNSVPIATASLTIVTNYVAGGVTYTLTAVSGTGIATNAGTGFNNIFTNATAWTSFTNQGFNAIGVVTNDANGKLYTSPFLANSLLPNPLIAPGPVSATQITNTSFAATGVVTNDANGKTFTSTLSPIIDSFIGNTRGAILERAASGWVQVAPGTAGFVLTANGTGSDPTYQAVVGTSIPATITPTNFVANQYYTNKSGSVQLADASIALITTGVSGVAAMDLMADQNGGNTFALADRLAISTLVTSLAMNFTNNLSCALSNNAVYYFTNTSSGAGDSSAIVPGTGELVTLADGAAAGVAMLGSPNTFTANNIFNAGLFGNAGSLTNVNGQSLTGMVQSIQWDASAFMTNGSYNSNAITYVTPSAGSGGLQGSAPFYLLYPFTPNVAGTAVACTNQFFVQTYMPPEWNSNSVSFSVDVVLATNAPTTATSMVFSVSASWNGSALTSPVTVTSTVPTTASFITTNFLVGAIPTSGTITPNESVVFQVQYWSVGNGKITNNAWGLGARCALTNSPVQNGAVTLR